MMPIKVLAFSAISDRIGLVLLADGRLKDWRTSKRAARSSIEAAGFAQKMINFYQPDVVVTEKVSGHHKSKATRKLINAMAMVASENYVLDVAVKHCHPYPSKYEEAEALVKRYPALLPWLPVKRRFFDHEPRAMLLFEALSLADRVASGPADRLAGEM